MMQCCFVVVLGFLGICEAISAACVRPQVFCYYKAEKHLRVWCKAIPATQRIKLTFPDKFTTNSFKGETQLYVRKNIMKKKVTCRSDPILKECNKSSVTATVICPDTIGQTAKSAQPAPITATMKSVGAGDGSGKDSSAMMFYVAGGVAGLLILLSLDIILCKSKDVGVIATILKGMKKK